MDLNIGGPMTAPPPVPAGSTHRGDPAPDQAALPIRLPDGAQGFVVLYPAACDLLGWSVRAANSNSTLQLMDGTEAAAHWVGQGAPNDLNSDTQYLGRAGVRVSTQLAALIGGDLTGCVYIRPRPKGQ